MENKKTISVIDMQGEEMFKKIFEMADHFQSMPDSVKAMLVHTNDIYKHKNDFGFVYFLKNKDTGLTKIGKTKKLENRMKSLASIFKNTIGILPDLEIVGLLFTHDKTLSALEAEIHRKLKEYRKYGEWFDLKDLEFSSYFPVDKDDVILIGNVFVGCNNSYDLHLYKSVDVNTKEEYIYKFNNNLKAYTPIFDFIMTWISNPDIAFSLDVLEDEKISSYITNPDASHIYSILNMKEKAFNPKLVLDAIETLKNYE